MKIYKKSQEESYRGDYNNFRKLLDSGKIEWRSPSVNITGELAVLIYLGDIKQPEGARVNVRKIYVYKVMVRYEMSPDGSYRNMSARLYFNKSRDPSGKTEHLIEHDGLMGDESTRRRSTGLLKEKFGIDSKLPHEVEAAPRDLDNEKIEKRVRLTRTKLIERPSYQTIRSPRSLEIVVSPAKMKGSWVSYVTRELETSEVSPPKFLIDKPVDSATALKKMEEWIQRAIGNGYVGSDSPYYIPKWANSKTWDFIHNAPKENLQKPSEKTPSEQKSQDDINEEEELLDLLAMNNKNYKTSQDYEGYFGGEVPDYAVNMMDSGMVDASQIKSSFGKASEAVDLVNKYNSSLLSNVSFIFNFAKGGAYGVYLSALDRAIKTKALQKKLEQMGYQVEQTEQGLTAFSQSGDQTAEDIQKDIDNIYSQLESKGGSAFGINMNAVMDASKQDAMAVNASDPDIWQWMAILHLGGTLVHEATHAKGATDEGSAEAAEQSFTNWALPIINEEYQQSMISQGKEEEFVPLTVGTGTRHASKTTWYKAAQQLSHYVPQSFCETPQGSDLKGRFPTGPQSEQGRADWGMMMQRDESVPIEKRLGRQYMSALPPDLNQSHDSYEEQLRKYTRDDWKLDPKATMEELLSEGHDDPRGYDTLEALLNEKRVKPIIIPLEKNASKLQKTATTFGWMNNLEISDGSTIPGLSDRVMAWDDRDESFTAEEDWIRQQPRYNPTYDLKGFYYRWIEPRFKPQLFDDMTRDYSGTHPAKRFASKIDPDVSKILFVLSLIKKKLSNKNVNSTRLLITEDVMPLIDRVFGDNFQINVFYVEDNKDGEEVLSVWISDCKVCEEKIEIAEKFFQQRESSDIVEEVLEELLGCSAQKERTIAEVLNEVKNICIEYGIRDVYVVGGYPRDLVMGSIRNVEDLDFSGSFPNQCVKVGGLLAEKLGVRDVHTYHRTNTLSFHYKDMKLDFRGNFSPVEIRSELRERDIPTTALNLDIYNRDFTINMLVYDILEDRVYDISSSSKKDIDREIIRTFLNPAYVCEQNPLIITRALKFKIRYGFGIDCDLQEAMKRNKELLFEKIPKSRLILAREDVKKEGKIEAEELFKEYGLQELEEL